MSKGLAQHIASLHAMQGTEVRVGWFEENKYANGQSVAGIMAQNEYGGAIAVPARTTTIYRSVDEKTGDFKNGGKFVKASKSNFATTHEVPAHTITIPSRPLMRQTASVVNQKIGGFLNRRVADVMKGKLEAEQVPKLIGEAVLNEISNQFKSGGFVPNAPSTVAKKGFNKPLIDSAIASQSVQAKVFKS